MSAEGNHMGRAAWNNDIRDRIKTWLLTPLEGSFPFEALIAP